jgi:hypothetical protein
LVTFGLAGRTGSGVVPATPSATQTAGSAVLDGERLIGITSPSDVARADEPAWQGS